MRKAAPELCQQMDKLRKERKTALERCWYLHSIGKEEDAAEVQQRIDAIDAEVGNLHAAAKQQMIDGVTKTLKQESDVLYFTTLESKTIRESMSEENKRHHEAVAALIAKQQGLDSQYDGVYTAMDEAADDLIDGSNEQATEQPGAPGAVGESNDATPAGSSTDTKNSSPARSSTDIHCPHCSKKCSGAKGLASHLRCCKKKAEQAPGAEVAADVDKDNGPNEDDGTKFTCPGCPKTYDSERGLRGHRRHCKGAASGNKPMPPAPGIYSCSTSSTRDSRGISASASRPFDVPQMLQAV